MPALKLGKNRKDKTTESRMREGSNQALAEADEEPGVGAFMKRVEETRLAKLLGRGRWSRLGLVDHDPGQRLPVCQGKAYDKISGSLSLALSC